MKKIVFADRDGVINRKAAEHEYVTSADEFEFNDGIFELLREFKAAGYELIVITNQRGIARGKMTETDLQAIHQKMLNGLKDEGIDVLDIFYCPHEADSCDCRKPQPGLLNQATAKYLIDLADSVLLSDSASDTAMGKAFGIGRTILVRTDSLEVLEDSSAIQ